MGLSIFQSLLNVSTLAKGSISCIVPAITLNHMKYTVSSLVKDQNVSFVIPPFRYNFVYLFFFWETFSWTKVHAWSNSPKFINKADVSRLSSQAANTVLLSDWRRACLISPFC